MIASKPSLIHAAALLALVTPALSQLNALTYVGCFKNKGNLGDGDTYQFQSDGHCQGVCVQNNRQAVLGLTTGDTCLCGSQTPNNSDKVDDSSCNTPCQGYGEHMCGGSGFYSVYLTGTEENVQAVGGGSTSSSGTKAPTSSTNSAPSVITSIAPGRTVVVTQSATADAAAAASQSPAPDNSKPNTTAIVAGVVVGGVVAAALAGGAFFFIRHRRRRQEEEEYKQHQVSDFMAGSKGSIPARKPSGPDSRFDAEAMANRRLSDGSIADNEDYSRRILKVANPDDH
ncbi:Cell wall integrity and stress response component 1 [Sphaceloma murrayae]|uniref:Cell wall integrity and stress response component 1 n=1 Tax=Sphaceloma murrayae TaxID=2082308 RepID=A0A2K1R286_9PEZI|nr:Cell wall integrity and stress response component 1 [Sphaceloma murrayae]